MGWQHQKGAESDKCEQLEIKKKSCLFVVVIWVFVVFEGILPTGLKWFESIHWN